MSRARFVSTSVTAIVQRATHDRLLVVLLFSTIALAGALSPMQNDTWWHMRAGADMWASRHVLLTDIYSHTAHGAFWPNHEWLSDLIFYGLYRVGGLPLVSMCAAAIIMAAWTMTWRLTAGSSMRRFLMIAPVLLPASLHWEPRPHVFSLLFLLTVVTLALQGRYLWLPLVFWVWANCHGGVLLGFVVIIAAAAAEVFEDHRRWWRVALVIAACALAATATPLGTSFWIEIPKSMARIRQYPINEWQRPELTDKTLLPFWAVAIVFVAALARQWRELVTHGNRRMRMLCLCALALLPLALSAVRNVGPFVMLAIPALSVLVPLDFARDPARRRQRPLLNAAIMSVASLTVVITIAYAYRFQIDHLRWTPLPQASLQALQRCPDNLYNRYDEGGFLIWFARDRLVFLDGRQDPYPPSLIHEHMRTETSGDYASTFARYNIHCAYLPVSSPVAARLSAVGWTALYRDPKWVVLTE